MRYTVGQRLQSIIIGMAQERAIELMKIGAPQVMIDSLNKHIEETKENVSKKVAGLSRKYKIADEEIIEAEQFYRTTGNYYKEGKKPTVIYRFVTNSGIYYYDAFDMKIGKASSSCEDNSVELSAHVPVGSWN